MSRPSVSIRPGPASVQDFAGTNCFMGDWAAIRATGGVGLQDDHGWIDGAAGPRVIQIGSWDTFPTGAGGVQIIDDTNVGLQYTRCNLAAGTAGMRSRKQFNYPVKVEAAAAPVVGLTPWRGIFLEMYLRYGTLFNVTPDNYFFGWHSNFVATDFAGGSCVAFVVTNGAPAVISAVIRTGGVGETRFTLPISTDDDWHVYTIISHFQSVAGVNAPGPEFYVDGALQQVIPSGHANLPRGPMYVKIGHFNETNASIANAWTTAGYIGRRRSLRP